MILVIDHFDSFVHNLARYFEQLGQETLVLRSNAVPRGTIDRVQPDAIVLSPGPCSPREAGNSIALVCEHYSRIPMLGVCLGHQIMAASFGATIERASVPMHGRASTISHLETDLFADLPNPLMVGRYHSLVVNELSLSDELIVTARTDDGTVMALRHAELPVFGVQFHPESVLTIGGYTLLANFLRLADCRVVPPPDVPSPVHSTALSRQLVPPVVPIPY